VPTLVSVANLPPTVQPDSSTGEVVSIIGPPAGIETILNVINDKVASTALLQFMNNLSVYNKA